MKTRLPAGRPIGPALVRLAAGLVGEAARRLRGAEADPVEAVHEARVALKRARSALRLLESADAAWARAPRLRLAELARELSAAREAAVAAGLAADLRRRTAGAQREVADILRATAAATGPGDLHRLRNLLSGEARALAAAPAPRLVPAGLKGLLRDTLDRADGRHGAAEKHPTHAKLHEWRKALIVLRDQTAMAAAIWPAGAGRAHRLLVPLARELGGIGDLLLLETRIRQAAVPRPLRAEARALAAELRSERSWKTAMLLRDWPIVARRLRRLLAPE